MNQIGSGLDRAQRIEYGVDIATKENTLQTIIKIKQYVAVEICLTSNKQILDVINNEHLFPLYVTSGIPVILAMDDASILCITLTEQFAFSVYRY
ncbi:unnamed protein product [Didymodactylos carnosus]|uniref:Uncharacterized protein n=1 Tax=Didymodactylos carnosus TaxID=1234261 RepID=A0A8S2QS76_9BILA|nr:unnamed protein product [Didymodactylos carnosus]CAF4110141.1 unnamed protein product [Didymodactylos carnosus]